MVNSLGVFYSNFGCFVEAVWCFRRSLAFISDAAQNHGPSYDKNLHLAIVVQESLESILNYAVDRWHFRMLNDGTRNTAFAEAIQASIGALLKSSKGQQKASITVLDIGAGTGILSMLAARAGADRVYGVEVSR